MNWSFMRLWLSCIDSNFDKYILQRVHASCIRIGHGYVLNGKRHYIGRSLGWGGCIDSIQHTEELWHKLSIEVSDERHVDVYLGKRFVASFSSHFATKGRGGPMLLSGNHQATFRNLNIKGTGWKYLLSSYSCDILSYWETQSLITMRNILQTQEHYYHESWRRKIQLI